MEETKGKYEIVSLEFSDSPMPVFKEDRVGKFIKFGEDNKYPDYIQSLYDKSPTHGAIINGKANYVYGLGFKAEDETVPNAKNFIARANRIAHRCCIDIENNGGCYLEMIPNRLGHYFFSHIPFKNMRSDKTNTMFYYKQDWNDKQEKPVPYRAFQPGIMEKTILFYKEYRPGIGTYPMPKWWAACNYIEADIEVSKGVLTNAKTGFSASKLITFRNGAPPTKEGKREVTRQFKNEHGGATGEKIVIAFVDPGVDPPTVQDLGASDLTKENFTGVNNLIDNKIFVAHSVTHPLLFGIQTPGKLGSATELRTAYEIFKNTYATPKQQNLEDIFNYIAELNEVATTFSIQPLQPIGLEYSDQLLLQAAPRSWLLEQIGIDPSVYTDAPVQTQASPIKADTQMETQKSVTPSQEVNNVLTNLTGRQRQNIMSIMGRYAKGKLTYGQASILLKSGYGFTDEEVSSFLGEVDTTSNSVTTKQGFSANDDEDVVKVFESFGESSENFTKVTSHKATFRDTEEDNLVSEAVTVAKKAKKVFPSFEVRYSYEKRPDADGPELLPTSRPFCVKMIALDRLYTRTEIQNISQILGYDVFNRTGGYWNNDGTIEKHCRHEFRSNVVIRK